MSGLEIILEDAAKSAFVKAQSVYRGDHDHFPLRATWETTTESVREGWRSIAYAALEAAYMPPLGTQPEPRKRRDVSSALASHEPSEEDVEHIALAICRCGRHETGQGTCSLICMDQLGDPRSKGCPHAKRVHEAEARAVLSAIRGRS